MLIIYGCLDMFVKFEGVEVFVNVLCWVFCNKVEIVFLLSGEYVYDVVNLFLILVYVCVIEWFLD